MPGAADLQTLVSMLDNVAFRFQLFPRISEGFCRLPLPGGEVKINVDLSALEVRFLYQY